MNIQNKSNSSYLESPKAKDSTSYRSPHLKDDENDRLIENVKKSKSQVIISNFYFIVKIRKITPVIFQRQDPNTVICVHSPNRFSSYNSFIAPNIRLPEFKTNASCLKNKNKINKLRPIRVT